MTPIKFKNLLFNILLTTKEFGFKRQCAIIEITNLQKKIELAYINYAKLLIMTRVYLKSGYSCKNHKCKIFFISSYIG